MDGKSVNQAKARMIILAIFVIGFAAGALSMNLYQRSLAKESSDFKRPENPQDHIIQQMTKEVGLTNEQRDQIKPVLDETFSQYGEIRKEMQPHMKVFDSRFDAVRQKSRDRIRALLTEEQLPKFNAWLEEQDARREKYRERNKK